MNHRTAFLHHLNKRTAIAAAIVVLTGPSWAQSVLPEVVITATRRTENIQKVPIAVTSISADDLQERGITDILSLDKAVPGLKIANSGNDPTPILRGAGVAGTTDIAVPFYVDGIYRPRSGQGLASYLDLEQVDVLRGPQGTRWTSVPPSHLATTTRKSWRDS